MGESSVIILAIVVILGDCGRDLCSEAGTRLFLIASVHFHDVGD
jgi:hypothetical protein